MLWLAAVSGFAQLSPQQLEAASADFNSVSARQLSQIDAYLLCAIVGGSTPQAAVTASIGFQALSDRQLQNVIAYELSLIAAGADRGAGLVLDPPHVGIGRNYPGPFVGSNTSTNQIFVAPGLSGQIRSLFVHTDVAGGHGVMTNLQWLNLRMYPDCGSTTNPPSAANLAFDVPIGLLLSDFYRNTITNNNRSIVRDSAFIHSVDVSTNVAFGASQQTFILKMVVPFTNGIMIGLYNTFSNNWWPFGYFNANYETGTLAYAFNNYRLRSAVYTNYALQATNITLASITATEGLVAGVMMAINNISGVAGEITDGNSFKFVTGPGVTNTWSGGDDLVDSTWGFSGTGEFGHSDVGVLHCFQNVATGQRVVEFYRWFVRDHFTWSNPAGLMVYHGNGATVDAIATAILYYSP